MKLNNSTATTALKREEIKEICSVDSPRLGLYPGVLPGQRRRLPPSGMRTRRPGILVE